MPFNVDPDLPVPLGVQLRGVIEYGIVCGQFPRGFRLPTVRALASELGIAPMTVSQVYKELKAVGLLETKPGHGTFVSMSVLTQLRPELLELQRRVDQLFDDAIGAGLSGGDLVALVNARINRRGRTARSLRLVFVGLFEDATRAYGADIQARLRAGDSIQTTTLAEIAGNDLARQRMMNADLVLTLANRKAEVMEIVGPRKRVLGVSFIPSERTRTLLAQIDPLARVAIVSTFPEFLPIMKAGVQRFAPHVHDTGHAARGRGSRRGAAPGRGRGLRHRLRARRRPASARLHRLRIPPHARSGRDRPHSAADARRHPRRAGDGVQGGGQGFSRVEEVP